MSPSVHKADKYKLLVRMEKEYKEVLDRLMKKSGDKDMTVLMKRLIAEEAKRKGIK